MLPSTAHQDDYENIRRLLHLDADTGELLWLSRDEACRFRGKTSARPKDILTFNSRYAGKKAGCVRSDGYLSVRVFKEEILSHRIVWLLVTGSWPAHTVDHINGNRADNRFVNLRDVPIKINSRNHTLRASSSTGVCGVSWSKARRKYHAYIRHENRVVWLGTHETLESATRARKTAERAFEYHENHGKPRA